MTTDPPEGAKAFAVPRPEPPLSAAGVDWVLYKGNR
jgi:hypothetical protein